MFNFVYVLNYNNFDDLALYYHGSNQLSIKYILLLGHSTIIAGPSIGEECYFPFEYKGNNYSTCTNEDSDSGPWCASKPVYSKGYFGYCKCPYNGN